jgi:thiol-disulfide isomerase/thioredoxin
MVDFWATWCGPCVAEFPNVHAAYEKYHSKGFDIVGVSLDEDRAALDGFIKDKGVAWPQYFDGKGWENKLARQYGITSIPATYLLDQNGKIVSVGLRGSALDTELATLLSKQ